MEGERNIAGLSCGQVLAHLDAFVDGSLDAEVRAQLVAHVSACAQCERFGRTYAAVVQRVRNAARGADPAEAVLGRLRARLDAMPASSREPVSSREPADE
jgi:anti-sigma factor RsiW